MATLILTTVGRAVGGPIGGAIGALLGSTIDRTLFAPKGRQGPRLGDLTVQTSSYGSAIPKIFGTLRVAGTVIWSTDLKEDKHKSGGGKGRPSTTSYSYSASFAVALSGRRVASLGRIWADGKLLRGSGGDWKSQLGAFRLHDGGEDQAADPLIVAAEGDTPAFRGIAYALFEDLELADFGNRIPSLTFEVIAEADAVGAGTIAADLTGGAVDGSDAPPFAGFAASGDSVRGALEALAQAVALPVRDDGARLLLGAAATTGAIVAGELGAAADGKRVARLSCERDAAGVVPDEVAIGYYEPLRDWQAGLQRATRDGGPGRRALRIELPAALAAGEAKAVAERRLAGAWAERRRATVRLPWRRIGVAPGDRVTVPGLDGRWRVASAACERMVVELALVAEPAGGAGDAASAGRATGDPDAPVGTTVLALLDLPPLDGQPGDRLRLHVAAAGTGAGWRRAALLVSTDAGASWQEAGGTAAPATIGTADGALADGAATLFDRRDGVEVTLANDAMWLAGCDDDALANGANLAMLGGELIQFGEATPLGAGRFRLARLLRGRRGTEAAMAGHAPGEAFVLIEAAALAPIELPLAAIGAPVRVLAVGLGDPPAGVEASAVADGRALRPPPPVALTAAVQADGAILCGWTRRSRTGWAWLDGADAPLGEEREAYRLTLTPNVGTPRTAEVTEAAFRYDAATRAADGAGAATALAIEVRQIGTVAPSLPAAADFTL